MHPQAERASPDKQESNFLRKLGTIFEEIGEIWTVEVNNLVVLACVLRATTKNGRQLFGRRKVHPRENTGYAYATEINTNLL